MVRTKATVPVRNIIGVRVREARRTSNPRVTQDDLSGRLAKAGVQLDRVAIAKIETGSRCAFDFEVKAIAIALDVSVSWLLDVRERVPRSSMKGSH
jgi:hypothetical protein